MLFLDYIRSLPAYHELTQVHTTNEGNLLELTDKQTAEAQISFLIWALGQIDVIDVLEIGTNKGLFGLVLSVICGQNVGLTTVDINPDSAKAADILEAQTNLGLVYFVCGDSVDVLPNLKNKKFTYDFAWIDGHHGYEHAYSDLVNCSRLEIPYIAIDDTNMDTVEKAYLDFLTLGTYQEVENPFLQHDSRRARLLKRVV